MGRQFRNDDSSMWAERYGNGSNGTLTISGDTTDSTANTGCSGTSGTTALTVSSGTGFAVGDLVLIHQSDNTGNVGVWELNKISSKGAGTNWTMAYNLQATYGSHAQVYLLKQYSQVTINTTRTLTAIDWDVTGTQGGILAILCNGKVTINGTLSAQGKGYRGAPSVRNADGKQGEGYNADGGTTSINANTVGGGGGWAGDNHGGFGGGAGGGGGHASAGSGGGGAGTAGSGGTAGQAGIDNTALSIAHFGGGGGSGGEQYDQGNAGAGGDGGGGIIVIAPIIEVVGGINANGNVGDDADGGISDSGGGGGGAGGFVLLKGAYVDVGTNLITVAGGAGGNGQGTHGDGGAGAVGRIHVDYGSVLKGSATPTIDERLDPILASGGGGILLTM